MKASQRAQYYEGPDPKWKVYGDLLKHADSGQIDIKAIAEKHQTTPQHVGAYLKNLRSGLNIYKELLKAGYDEPVILGWEHRPGRVDIVSARRTSLEQGETPRDSPLGEGVTETQLGDGQVQPSTFKSRELPDSELSRLGIVRGGDGKYYKASDGPGGSIVLRPVDPNIAAAAAKTGLDVSGAINEAATEQYKINMVAIAGKVALSPVVFMGHAFAVEKDLFEGDIGDCARNSPQTKGITTSPTKVSFKRSRNP